MRISEESAFFVRREGYTDPEHLLQMALKRAEGAVWHALPIEPGHYVSWRGEHYETIPGTLSGERSVWFYLQNGPYLRVPDDVIERIKNKAAERAEFPLQERIDRALSVLRGEEGQ